MKPVSFKFAFDIGWLVEKKRIWVGRPQWALPKQFRSPYYILFSFFFFWVRVLDLKQLRLPYWKVEELIPQPTWSSRVNDKGPNEPLKPNMVRLIYLFFFWVLLKFWTD